MSFPGPLMSQDPPAFSALWAARQEAMGLGAEPGASCPLQWVVRDPGASPLLGEGRYPSCTAGTSPDHGQARASSRKSWATQGGRLYGALMKAGSRAGSAPRSGAAPGHSTGSLPPRWPPDQPLCGGWVSHREQGPAARLGTGSGSPSRAGATEPAVPQCDPLVPPLPEGLWAQGFQTLNAGGVGVGACRLPARSRPS